MTFLRPLLVLLAFYLALVVPAQAGGWLGGADQTCLHLMAGPTQATAPDAAKPDGIIAPLCHAMAAIVGADAILSAGVDGAGPVVIEARLDLSLRPAGIDRPPKPSPHLA